jgi:N-acetylglucosaminyldiphosphoundecaprenol N-acetyl-beta-D-mannosaminyltransferase
MLSGESTSPTQPPQERVLGLSFFNGTCSEAVEHFLRVGGLLVAPVSPALVKLKYDVEYRRALQTANVTLADSVLLSLLWRIASGRRLRKNSGLSYLKALLGNGRFREETAFWLVSSDAAKENAVRWLREHGFADRDNVCVVIDSDAQSERYELLTRIENQRPVHVMIALRSGGQEKLGMYLREYLVNRPAIHCIGAALGFLTGDEAPIPDWAERYGLGWLARLVSQPRMFFPRLGSAGALAGMVFRYRTEMPHLRDRWADM